MERSQREDLEREIRRLCEAGDPDAAIARALEGYGPELYGFLVGLAGDVDRAGDAFGAACERLWRALPAFRWECTFRVWAYTVARNEHYRALRAGRREVPLSEAPAVTAIAARVRTATPAYQRTDVKDAFARIREALAPEDHMLLGLRLDRKMAWNDIARILGSGEAGALAREAATLRKRYERLKLRLRALAADVPA